MYVLNKKINEIPDFKNLSNPAKELFKIMYPFLCISIYDDRQQSNYIHHIKQLTYDQLIVLSGISKTTLKKSLSELKEKNFIDWEIPKKIFLNDGTIKNETPIRFLNKQRFKKLYDFAEKQDFNNFIVEQAKACAVEFVLIKKEEKEQDVLIHKNQIQLDF